MIAHVSLREKLNSREFLHSICISHVGGHSGESEMVLGGRGQLYRFTVK